MALMVHRRAPSAQSGFPPRPPLDKQGLRRAPRPHRAAACVNATTGTMTMVAPGTITRWEPRQPQYPDSPTSGQYPTSVRCSQFRVNPKKVCRTHRTHPRFLSRPIRSTTQTVGMDNLGGDVKVGRLWKERPGRWVQNRSVMPVNRPAKRPVYSNFSAPSPSSRSKASWR